MRNWEAEQGNAVARRVGDVVLESEEMMRRFIHAARGQAGVPGWAGLWTTLLLLQAPAGDSLSFRLLSRADSAAGAGDSSQAQEVCSASLGFACRPEPGMSPGLQDQHLGLAVSPEGMDARLECAHQRLAGHASREGLWLTSTLDDAPAAPFRVLAVEILRSAPGEPLNAQASTARCVLDSRGSIVVDGGRVRFVRPLLTEEYSVGLGGIRQDFVVMERRPGSGPLAVRLAVSGAKCEAASFGARLVLDGSGRKIAYSKLRVTDAEQRELAARIDVAPETTCGEAVLTVTVQDERAVYPVRIDPTFSDENWISLGGLPGANGTVRAAATDGSGNLYVGGDFTAVGGVSANRVARWNGSGWAALGTGMDGTVYSLAVVSGEVYAGGVFTNAGGIAANRVAKWDGNGWLALGAGMNSTVYALVGAGTNVYAGGNFTTAGGGSANRIARWDGNSWLPLGSGLSGPVLALTLLGSNLVAGGSFTSAGGNPANRIALWNGSAWSPLGLGLNSVVYALGASGTNVYAGGMFTTAGGNPAVRIARWDGSWSALGSGADGTVRSVAVDGSGRLYLGGDFSSVDGLPSSRVAQWDGNSWLALGSGCDGSVNVLVAAGGELFAGGTFDAAGAGPAMRVARWDGSSWSALGSGMNNEVRALAVLGNDVYAGGAFVTAGSVLASHIARWNGSSWSSLGSGVDGTVLALAVSGSNVYAGGSFTHAGGVLANYIAKWDGANWSALGSGMNSWVYCLAVAGSNVYAGGAFTNAGGTAASRIARWNGNSWSPLGTGVESFVYALAASGETLYAGGAFTTAGGGSAQRVARWNGSGWSPMDSGMNGSVLALAVSGSQLYAGGSFTTGSVSEVNYIAQWDAGQWTALGAGVNSAVNALAIAGSNLYVGGEFTRAGDSPAYSMATWDGTNWSALGSGMNSAVHALAATDNAIYAGGVFTTAGGRISGYAAKALFATNASPTNIILNPSSVAENEPAGTVIGDLLAEDPDPGDHHTFALVSGAGDADNGGFTLVDGTNLLSAASFDHETQPNRSIRVRATDAAGAAFERVLGITVLDVNEAPQANAGGPYTNELGSPLSLDGNGSADPDAGDSLTYAWDLDDDGQFDDATGAAPVVPTVTLTNLGLGQRIIRLRVTDGGGLMDTNATSLTLLSAPVITAQPQSRTNGVGTVAAFSIAAWGTPPLVYQWWRGPAMLSGQTNESYSIPAVSTNDSGGYFVVVTNAAGSLTSSVALLTVAVPADVITAPRLVGTNLVVRFAGTPGLTYTIEHTGQLGPVNWQKTTNCTAPSTDMGLGVGAFEFTDSVEPQGQRFYRSVFPAY